MVCVEALPQLGMVCATFCSTQTFLNRVKRRCSYEIVHAGVGVEAVVRLIGGSLVLADTLSLQRSRCRAITEGIGGGLSQIAPLDVQVAGEDEGEFLLLCLNGELAQSAMPLLGWPTGR